MDVGPDVDAFVDEAPAWERVRVQALSPAIAIRAAMLSRTAPMDPADHLIAATAMHLNVPLITSDVRLRALTGLRSVW